MRSQSTFVTFHPELFQVKSKCQKEQLCADVLSSPREKTAEPEVILKQAKGALYLDRPTLTKIDTVVLGDVFKRCLP